MEAVLARHIEITPNVRGGRPRIAGTRITVADIIIMHLRLGLSLEEIAGKYDLDLAVVGRLESGDALRHYSARFLAYTLCYGRLGHPRSPAGLLFSCHAPPGERHVTGGEDNSQAIPLDRRPPAGTQRRRAQQSSTGCPVLPAFSAQRSSSLCSKWYGSSFCWL